MLSHLIILQGSVDEACSGDAGRWTIYDAVPARHRYATYCVTIHQDACVSSSDRQVLDDQALGSTIAAPMTLSDQTRLADACHNVQANMLWLLLPHQEVGVLSSHDGQGLDNQSCVLGSASVDATTGLPSVPVLSEHTTLLDDATQNAQDNDMSIVPDQDGNDSWRTSARWPFWRQPTLELSIGAGTFLGTRRSCAKKGGNISCSVRMFRAVVVRVMSKKSLSIKVISSIFENAKLTTTVVPMKVDELRPPFHMCIWNWNGHTMNVIISTLWFLSAWVLSHHVGLVVRGAWLDD